MDQKQPERSSAADSVAGDAANGQLSDGSCHGSITEGGDNLPPSYGAGTTERIRIDNEADSLKKGVFQKLKDKFGGNKHRGDPAVDHHEDDAAMAEADEGERVGCMEKLKAAVKKNKARDETGPANAAPARDDDSPRVDRCDGKMGELMHRVGDHGHRLLHHHDDPETIKPNAHGIKSSDPGNIFVPRDDQHAPGSDSAFHDHPLMNHKDQNERHHDLQEKAPPSLASDADSFPEDQTSSHVQVSE